MQRRSIGLWILVLSSRVHAQPRDHFPPQVASTRQEPRPEPELLSPQGPPSDAPLAGKDAGRESMMPIVPDTPVSRPRKLVAAGLAAGGATAIGIGLIVGAGARSTYGEVKALCGSDLVCDTPATFQQGHHLVGNARLEAAISTVAIAAGGAAIATGLVVWLTAPRERPAESTRIVPIVSAKDVALAVTGRF